MPDPISNPLSSEPLITPTPTSDPVAPTAPVDPAPVTTDMAPAADPVPVATSEPAPSAEGPAAESEVAVSTPDDTLPAQSVPEPVEAPRAEVIPETANIPSVSPSPAPEIVTQVEQNTAHTTPSQNPVEANSSGQTIVAEPVIERPPHQNLEIPNLGGQEAELLAAEIAQRKLLKPSNRFMRWLSARSLMARKLRAQKKSDKIMALFDQYEQITNELVRKNLHFPKQTAGNHLELLEKEGKIKRVGTGKKVFFVKV